MQQIDLERVVNALHVTLGHALGGLRVEIDQGHTHAFSELCALFGDGAQGIDQHHEIGWRAAFDTCQFSHITIFGKSTYSLVPSESISSSSRASHSFLITCSATWVMRSFSSE